MKYIILFMMVIFFAFIKACVDKDFEKCLELSIKDREKSEVCMRLIERGYISLSPTMWQLLAEEIEKEEHLQEQEKELQEIENLYEKSL